MHNVYEINYDVWIKYAVSERGFEACIFIFLEEEHEGSAVAYIGEPTHLDQFE